MKVNDISNFTLHNANDGHRIQALECRTQFRDTEGSLAMSHLEP